MRKSIRRGITKVELVFILLLIIVLIAVLIPLLQRARFQAKVIKDGGQIRGIHQSFLISGREFGGRFLTPGALRRLPVMIDGQATIVPGQGEIDVTQNDTANIYSMMIMQNYFSPELTVSALESNPKVTVRANYNWVLFSPNTNNYWDPGFAADLEKGSNVSYAHMPLFGDRFDGESPGWQESLSSRVPQISTRGPRDGQDPNSLTYKIYPPYDQWVGSVVFNDNSIVSLNSQMTVGQITVDGKTIPDNIFRFDDGLDGADAILTFTKKMTAEGPEVQWD